MYGTIVTLWRIETIVSILMKVLRWSRTISHLFLRICCIMDDWVHFIWMRVCINNYPHPVYGFDRYWLKKKNMSLHDRLVFNTLYPPVNKLFLSVTKFSLYISPYISLSKLVPMTYVLPFLRVLLRRLRIPYEFVRKKHLIFNFLFMLNRCIYLSFAFLFHFQLWSFPDKL